MKKLKVTKRLRNWYEVNEVTKPFGYEVNEVTKPFEYEVTR